MALSNDDIKKLLAEPTYEEQNLLKDAKLDLSSLMVNHNIFSIHPKTATEAQMEEYEKKRIEYAQKIHAKVSRDVSKYLQDNLRKCKKCNSWLDGYKIWIPDIFIKPTLTEKDVYIVCQRCAEKVKFEALIKGK